MNTRIRPILLCAAVGAAVSMPAFAQDKSSGLHGVMAKSMKEMQSMPMTGDVDKDFAMMMKHHHQSGIEMAQLQVREGTDPELKQQAQKIIDGQKKEMADLDRWLQSKGGSQGAAKGGTSSQSSSSGASGQSGEHAGHK